MGRKYEAADRIGSSQGEINSSGCLINFKYLKPGDILHHISRGKVEVIDIDEKNTNYPVLFKYLESEKREEDYGSESEPTDRCTVNGFLFLEDKLPTIYAFDPFKYTVDLLKEKDEEMTFLKEQLKLVHSKNSSVFIPNIKEVKLNHSVSSVRKEEYEKRHLLDLERQMGLGLQELRKKFIKDHKLEDPPDYNITM